MVGRSRNLGEPCCSNELTLRNIDPSVEYPRVGLKPYENGVALRDAPLNNLKMEKPRGVKQKLYGLVRWFVLQL